MKNAKMGEMRLTWRECRWIFNEQLALLRYSLDKKLKKVMETASFGKESEDKVRKALQIESSKLKLIIHLIIL